MEDIWESPEEEQGGSSVFDYFPYSYVALSVPQQLSQYID